MRKAIPTGADECFVYVTLPGETEAVTAGRYVRETNRQGVTSGRFVYGRSYLARADAVEIDPAELKLGARTYETVLMKGLFGALRDAGPDYWGRRVIEKHAGLTELGELDYLLHSPDDRAGALGFGLGQAPPAPVRAFNRTLDLARLQEIADRLVNDETRATGSEAAQVEELLLLGTSMGGARPKAVVEDADGLWLAKFSRADDKWNMARVEHAMLLLARACGLLTATSRIDNIGDRHVLLVKRFDREKVAKGYTRARMVSALTLLRADETQRERWSYVVLAEELRRISADPKRDAAELFRRMLFNALISNIDDHPRNHAVITPQRDWRLSPAYDLTPSVPVSTDRRDLTMAAGDFGRWANARNMLSQAPRFLLDPAEASAMVDTMEEAVKGGWFPIARGAGVSEADCATIANAFAYPGFRLQSPEGL
ncbi:MAG: type II toxin-antitoxin system HipA family toxin [Methylobacterium sp.]|nr:type II toxin-antitoxin system HipA family toxin [Methylobacterium sp.]MCA3661187.1 type II toxin-antitoxin system HipA family toxin [Methylobacterium sp.]MCA3663975.1 type II toxin-antitoxin system HipA family toxin [Methylobacterium sp.]MCA3666981.1 type II toxin-antitoxin system HipA family toxin [Methylobacterium sp.]MCA3669422.1 type II toxin-antitoxin system HipA family toxin [Methylobacterium sp.]